MSRENEAVHTKRAILSVYDKRGIVEFAGFLAGEGFELVSSGGTASVLRDAGLAVKKVEEITGFPEMLDGRVKTLHPLVHAGILARRGRDEDGEALGRHGIVPIDWVVVNLYPFEEALSKGLDDAEQLEFIDIGGPTLLRAGAKNFSDVVVVCDPADYESLREEWRRGGDISKSKRRALAAKVFRRMKAYDGAIAEYLSDFREV